jgi:hypothetical protein
MTADHSLASTMACARISLTITTAIAPAPATPDDIVTATSTSAHAIRAKTMEYATITMDRTRANANRALAAQTASRLSTSVSRSLASMAVHASRLKKVTLSAFVARDFRDSFVN